jgi:hypothetical protein
MTTTSSPSTVIAVAETVFTRQEQVALDAVITALPRPPVLSCGKLSSTLTSLAARIVTPCANAPP